MAFLSSSKLLKGFLGAAVLLLITTTGVPSRQSPTLRPFSSQKEQKPRWLIATPCATSQQQRRNVIRTTWQSTYNNSLYDTRFILSKDDGLWDPIIKEENETFGDIIQLKDLDPSPETSNRIKMVEFLKYLVLEVQHGTMQKYDWVSKIDSDAFLEANSFYNHFLNSMETSNHTLIGRVSHNGGIDEFDWPGGAFYTFSWQLVEKIVHLANESPITDVPEDVLVGRYLYDGKVKFDFVDLGEKLMFDIPVDNAYFPRKITNEAILVHFIKEDEQYLEVASLFDKNGYNGKQIDGWTEGGASKKIESEDGQKKLDITHEPDESTGESRGGFK